MCPREVKQFYSLSPFSFNGSSQLLPCILAHTLPNTVPSCQRTTSWEGYVGESSRRYQERTLSNPCNGCDLPLKHLIILINQVIVLAILSKFQVLLHPSSAITLDSPNFAKVLHFKLFRVHLHSGIPGLPGAQGSKGTHKTGLPPPRPCI